MFLKNGLFSRKAEHETLNMHFAPKPVLWVGASPPPELSPGLPQGWREPQAGDIPPAPGGTSSAGELGGGKLRHTLPDQQHLQLQHLFYKHLTLGQDFFL